MKSLVIALLLSLGALLAQDKPAVVDSGTSVPAKAETKSADAPKPLSSDEKLAVRSAQVKLLQAQNQLSQAQQQFQSASQALTQTANAVYSARNITQDQYALCDGPAGGGCQAAPAGDLTLQAIPKKEEKSAEEKK